MQISFPLPENQFIAEQPEKVVKKIRLYAALGLYQAGELSIGAAAELAGVDRYEFLEMCKREGIKLRTPQSAEIEADVLKFSRLK